MKLPYSLSFKSYLYSLSLNFKKRKDAESYELDIRFHKLIFVRLALFWMVMLMIFMISLQNDVLFNSPKYIGFYLILVFGSIILNLLAKYVKNNLILDIYFTSFLLTLNVILIQYLIPNLFLRLNLKEGNCIPFTNSYYFLFMYLGVHLKIVTNFLNAAKIKWILISIYNIIINILILKEFIFLYRINGEGGLIMTITIPSCLLPIIISYFDEKTLKKVLINLNRAYENLEGFETLIDNIPNQIIILSGQNLELKFMNTKAKALFGFEENTQKLHAKLEYYKISDDENLDLFGICKDIMIKSDASSISEDLKEERFYNYNVIFKSAQETKSFDVKIGMTLWRSQKGILIILNDVSSKIQFLNEVNQYKDLLLASVSHDLRTPLNCIMGFLELLGEQIHEKKLVKYIQTAQNSSKMLLSLINDILDSSQISNKKLKLNYEHFYVEEIIKEIANMLKLQAKRKGIDFLYKISEGLRKKKIFGDQNRIEQILINLIGNAIKFTIKGSVTLNISLDDCEFHNYIHQVVAFTVIDTGIGIDEQNIHEIFNIFKKVNQDDPKINRAGIGLGLFLSQNIAKEMHDEGITVKSKKNLGSQFKFSIPFEENDIEPQTFDQRSTKIETESEILGSKEEFFHFNNLSLTKVSKTNFEDDLVLFKSKKLCILLVDDDAMNLLIHKQYAESLGIDSEVASNGLEALEKIENNIQLKNFFSCIFLDCNMPILNGFDTAKKIKAMIEEKVIPKIPIIALTANVTNYDILQCKESGMDHYLPKPVSKKVFREKMMEIFINENKVL